MKALVLAVLLPPLGAAAVSPEDVYLAARDRYIASFKTAPSAKDEKAVFARHDKALRDLERQLKPIVGPISASGFPTEGKLNLVSLFPDDIGFGMLDGLVYGSSKAPKALSSRPTACSTNGSSAIPRGGRQTTFQLQPPRR